MFFSLDYLYVPAPNIDAAVSYYTEQLGGELVWKIHAFDTWVAAVRLSASGPMVLLAAHLHGNTPILIYRVEHLESTVASLHARGWRAESGPFDAVLGALIKVYRCRHALRRPNRQGELKLRLGFA